MTRKDYVAFAQLITEASDAENNSQEAEAAVRTLARRIADVFAADNSRFDRARFLKACGLEG